MTTLAELRNANLQEQRKSALEPASPATPEPESFHEPELPESREDLILSQYVTEADPEAERAAAMLARVREMLTHKVLHPTGAKATVDMSPKLFHRAKRYCLDHGNVTLRQLFLDLMTAFLDEEGY